MDATFLEHEQDRLWDALRTLGADLLSYHSSARTELPQMAQTLARSTRCLEDISGLNNTDGLEPAWEKFGPVYISFTQPIRALLHSCCQFSLQMCIFRALWFPQCRKHGWNPIQSQKWNLLYNAESHGIWNCGWIHKNKWCRINQSDMD